MWAHARRQLPVALAAVAATVAAAGMGAGLASTPGAYAAAADCTVGYEVNQWVGGFTAAVRVTAGAAPVTSWSVTWTYAGDQRITSFWNADVVQSGNAVTARNVAFNGQLPAGGSTDFGVQGTFGTANPAPTSFALNGVPCNGGTAPSPPPSTPSPSTPPSTPPSSPPSSPPPPSVGCGTAAFCDGFEDQTGTVPSGTWGLAFPDCQGTGAATIDSTVAHAGRRSVKIAGTAGYCNHVFVKASRDLSTLGAVRFGRFWVRHSTALPTQHVTFVAMRDANDAGKDLRMGGQNGALQWNRASDDATLPEQSPTGVALSMPLATDRWSCVEFGIDGANGRLQTWVGGAAVTGLQADGTPTHDIDGQWTRATWRPGLTDLRIGWEAYGEGADTLWFDDVAVGTTRVGC